MLNYYTNSKYTKLLSKEIEDFIVMYKKYYKVRVTDEKSLRYTIGNILFNMTRSVNNKQSDIVFIQDKRFFVGGVIIDGKRCAIKVSYTFFVKMLEILEKEDF